MRLSEYIYLQSRWDTAFKKKLTTNADKLYNHAPADAKFLYIQMGVWIS